MEWLFLLLGVPIGVLGARADWLILRAWERWTLGKLRIKGHYAEFVPNSVGRQFSLGSISWRPSRRQYAFDGTNYRNDGEPFCHWRTVSSYLDRETNEYHYVFRTTAIGSLRLMSYGYGVVNLVQSEGALVPQDGYYVYVTPTGEVVSVDHTVVRIDALPATRTENAGELLARVLPEHKDRLDPPDPHKTVEPR